MALDLPGRVREGLVAWQARALTDPALRPVAPETLHVTLCFLGYQPEREIERIAEVMRSVGSGRWRPGSSRSRRRFRPSAPACSPSTPKATSAVALQARALGRLQAERFYRPRNAPSGPM